MFADLARLDAPDATLDVAALRSARRILDRARHVLVLSGAGMSAECGIPTFRGANGRDAWDDAATTLATPRGFRTDPQRVWTWYLHRRREALRAQPHPGYLALAAWERRATVSIVTQNVDGLHALAGSSHVVELHGTLHRFFCADQRHEVTGVGDQDEVPRCPRCGDYVRPAVVWFGEPIPDAAGIAAAEAVLRAEVVLLIGTSLKVTTPLGMLRHARRQGIPIIEVNPDPALPSTTGADAGYDLPPATITLAGTAGTVLPQLLDPGLSVLPMSK
jgi:NAD-dependent deacetylase